VIQSALSKIVLKEVPVKKLLKEEMKEDVNCDARTEEDEDLCTDSNTVIDDLYY
jgi:hypothetical protein